MRFSLISVALMALVVSACATTVPQVADSKIYPGCQSLWNPEQQQGYRCAIAQAEPATLIPKTARDGSSFWQISIDRGTSKQISDLDGRQLLNAWQRHCESPNQRAADIRFNERLMAETELICIIDRTLRENSQCPDDWLFVNADGTAPLSKAPAQAEGDRLVTYVACHAAGKQTARESRLAWPNSSIYWTLDITSMRLQTTVPCVVTYYCAPGERVAFAGNGNGFDINVGHHFNRYLAAEVGFGVPAFEVDNEITTTPNESSAYLTGFVTVRAGLRVQYPLFSSRAVLFARYAGGYQSGQLIYNTNQDETSLGHWTREFMAGAECRVVDTLILRATYTPRVTNGGVSTRLWSVGIVFSH